MPELGYSKLDQKEDGTQNTELEEITINDNENEANDDSSTPIIGNGEKSTDEQQTKESSIKNEGKFPWKILGPAYFVLLCDSIQMSAVTPFLPQLCTERFHISEANVGNASGLLIGIYAFALFCSSFFMGHLSDLYGRKPLLMLGSGVGAVMTFIFGVSPNYFLSLATRIVAGLTNANNALTKAVMSDVAHGKHRVIAFAYHGATFSMARAVASAMSGLTAGIVINLPFLNMDGYVLPSFLGGIIQAAAFFVAMFLIPETAKKDTNSPKKSKKFSLILGLKEIWKDKLMRKIIVLLCMNSFANSSLLLCIVLYWSLNISERGIGFSPTENGIAFTWFGTCAVIFQVFFFQKVLARIGIIKVYLMGARILTVCNLLLPLLSIFYWIGGTTTAMRVLTWIALTIWIAFMSVGFMTCLPIVGTFQSNIADPQRMGLVMGTGQSLASLARSVGPMIGGVLFSLSVSIKFPFFLFLLLTVIYLLCHLVISRMPNDELRRIESPREVAIELDVQITPKNKDEDTIPMLQQNLENGDGESTSQVKE